jgi:predicted ferric reductase
VISSQFRERLRIDYEIWRGLHLLLGVGAIVTAQVHVSLAGLYTNTEWKQAIWIVMAALSLGLVAYLRLFKPVWQRDNRWRVVDVTEDRGDTVRLSLEPDGHTGFRFAPGQFAWLKLDGSPFTLEEHPFSFSSSAEGSRRLEFGIKKLGDFSSAVGDVPAGTRAYLDGPHGAFSSDRYAAAGYVFLAGGIGITPFMSMLRTMRDREDRRPVLLIYADKGWDDVAYRDDLSELEQQLNLEIVYVLEEPPDDWEGEEGMIDDELLERHLPDNALDRVFMVCGPPPMMDAVQDSLRGRDVPQARIQLEKFALA